MADLEALKKKYAPVIESIQRFAPYGATLESVDLAGEQLRIRGTVPCSLSYKRPPPQKPGCPIHRALCDGWDECC
jgi:hypothetical protein